MKLVKRFLVGFSIVFTVALALTALGQPSPATRPVGSLAPGWEEIDQRLVFFTVQLAGTESSLEAVNKALRQAGYRQATKRAQAEQFEKGNERMDRNAGGPVGWKEFYGSTAERFFRASDSTSLRIVRESPTASLSYLREHRVATERPPQFDYIYRANETAQLRAAGEVAKLGGKIDALIARRRQLEAEQATNWARIAFRAVLSRKISTKPFYRFEVKTNGPDDATRQRQQAVRSGAAFVRTAVQALAEAEGVVDRDAMRTFEALQEVVGEATARLNDELVRLPSLSLDVGDAGTPLGRLVASADRLADVTKNVTESYRGALGADEAGDEGQKQSFRAFVQQALFDCAANCATSADFVGLLAKEWKVEVDASRPLAATQPSVIAAGRHAPAANTVAAPPPLSAEAVRERYESEIAKAKEEYDLKVQAAVKPYVACLEEAQKAAVKAGDLDSALAIKAEVESASSMSAPEPNLDSRQVYLDSLELLDFSSHSFGVKGRGGGYKLTVSGEDLPHGLFLHGNPNGTAYVRYRMPRGFRTFKTRVALTDAVDASVTPLTLKIVGDERVLWTKPLQRNRQIQEAEIRVTGLKTIELQVECPGSHVNAHVVWMDARLIR